MKRNKYLAKISKVLVSNNGKSSLVPNSPNGCHLCENFSTRYLAQVIKTTDYKTLVPYCELFDTRLESEDDKAIRCSECCSKASDTEYVLNTKSLK